MLTILFFWDTKLCHRVFVAQCFETAVTSLSRVSHPVVCLTIELEDEATACSQNSGQQMSNDEAQYP